MKSVTYDSGGHKFNIAVPESVEEYDSLAKKQGTCLEAAIDHEVYHGTLGDIREGFAAAVAEHYKSPRREIGTGLFEGEGENRAEVTKTEKNDVYLARVAAENNLTGEAPFQHIADSLSVGGGKEVKFDPSVRERKAPKPPTIAKKDIEEATKFLAESDEKRINKFITHAKSKFGVDIAYVAGDNEANIKAFARGSMDIRRATNAFNV